LDRITETARQQNIDVTWYRYNKHPVLLLRFQADRANPTFRLQQLDLHPQMLRITGRALESRPEAGPLSEERAAAE
jgi:hypothetical protein